MAEENELDLTQIDLTNDNSYQYDHVNVRAAWNRVLLLESGAVAPVPIRMNQEQQNSSQGSNVSRGAVGYAYATLSSRNRMPWESENLTQATNSSSEIAGTSATVASRLSWEAENLTQENNGGSADVISMMPWESEDLSERKDLLNITDISEPIAEISTNSVYSIPADSRDSPLPHDKARKLNNDGRERKTLTAGMYEPHQECTRKSYRDSFRSIDSATSSMTFGQIDNPAPGSTISSKMTWQKYSAPQATKENDYSKGICEPHQGCTRRSYRDTWNSTDSAMRFGQTDNPVPGAQRNNYAPHRIPERENQKNTSYSTTADPIYSTMSSKMTWRKHTAAQATKEHDYSKVAGMYETHQPLTGKSYNDSLQSTDSAMSSMTLGQNGKPDPGTQQDSSACGTSEDISVQSKPTVSRTTADPTYSTTPSRVTWQKYIADAQASKKNGYSQEVHISPYMSWWDREADSNAAEMRLTNANAGASSSSTSDSAGYHETEYSETFSPKPNTSRNTQQLKPFNGFDEKVEEEFYIPKYKRNVFPVNKKHDRFCRMCYKNNENNLYLTHNLKYEDGRVQCPVLRALRCVICQATGDNAHTLKYCPFKK